MSEKKVFSLSQLAQSIQNVLSAHSSKVVWIKAEIVKLNYYPKSGHCYPTLVEKKNGKVIAELRGNIWGTQFEQINTKFREVLKEELKDDMTVVVQGSVTFHPVHGLALNIIDIDPEYTLGELAREKAETIERLKSEEIYSANKTTFLPLLPKTIAIISVETSKGYGDFMDVIETNPWGYKFHFHLFPAILQGEKAIVTINQQLEKIRNYTEVFDAVAIIRGGGGEIGLSCFDNYSLAQKIATFPIPVLTGIGHSTNVTVSELVSFESFITPTKIAEFLLHKFNDVSLTLFRGADKLEKESGWIFKNEKGGLRETARLFSSLGSRVMSQNRSNIEALITAINSESKELLRSQKEELEDASKIIATATAGAILLHQNQLRQAEKTLVLEHKKLMQESQNNIKFTEDMVRILSPANILKRGYSITRQNGKVVKDPAKLDPSILLETRLEKGTVLSRIETTNKK